MFESVGNLIIGGISIGFGIGVGLWLFIELNDIVYGIYRHFYPINYNQEEEVENV